PREVKAALTLAFAPKPPGLRRSPASFTGPVFRSSRMATPAPLVGLIMGSKSDWETLAHAAETLKGLGVPFEAKVVSAHRTPQRPYEYATSAKSRGLQVITAGAGGAAPLPGMAASMTPLPVLGVPIKS